VSRRRTESRRLAAASGLLLGALWLGAPAAGAPEEARPNLLLIVAEDLSPRLGAYGDPVAHTPNLDRLAREGVRFEHAFATAGVCAPSRAALVMGVHQNRFGAGHMRAAQGGYVAVPPPDWKAFPELLRAARDRRFKYIRNLRPELPYQLPNAFGAAMPTWRELERLHDAGELTGDPRRADDLARLRAALGC